MKTLMLFNTKINDGETHSEAHLLAKNALDIAVL